MPADDNADDDYSYDYPAIEQARVFTIVIAVISALFPLSVVIILIQKYDILVRKKTLVHYILCIAMADTMTAISIAFGYPYAGTVACSIQGFALLLFERFSWFYTDVLVIQLFSVVVFKEYFLNIKYMHGIVWSLNLLLQFLPLTTGVSYGTDDGGIPDSACFLAGGKGRYDGDFWMQYTVAIEIVISFSLVIGLSLIIVYFCLRTDAYVFPIIRDSWSLVILYPGAMLVAWIPSMSYGYYLNRLLSAGHSLPDHSEVIYNYLIAVSALYGPFLSIIFYTKTIDARRAWLSNWRYIVHMITKREVSTKVDDGIRCSSIISIDDRLISEIRMSSLEKRSNQSGSGSDVVNPIKHNVSVNRINSTSEVTRIPESL